MRLPMRVYSEVHILKRLCETRIGSQTRDGIHATCQIEICNPEYACVEKISFSFPFSSPARMPILNFFHASPTRHTSMEEEEEDEEDGLV